MFNLKAEIQFRGNINGKIFIKKGKEYD